MTLKFFFRNPINNIKSEIVFYVYINYCQLATAKIDLSYIKTAVFYHIALYYSRSKKTFKKSLRTIEVSDFFDLQFTWFYMGGPRNRFKNTVYFSIFRSFLPQKNRTCGNESMVPSLVDLFGPIRTTIKLPVAAT